MQSPRGLILRRRASNLVSKLLGIAATVFGLSWLIWILLVTLINGARALSPRIFTEMTPPPGADGGLANALVGSALMSVLGVLIGAPLGIAAGTYLAEFAERRPVWRESIRFVNDILLSAPSIVLGLFVYTVYVRHSMFTTMPT
jgi:phosphate transport system permease protein